MVNLQCTYVNKKFIGSHIGPWSILGKQTQRILMWESKAPPAE